MKPRSTLDLPPTQTEQVHTSELEERIRRRAYELYEQRGRPDGHDVDDWLQAEAEMTQPSVRKAAA
jgi:hypothetical protein